MNTITGTFYYLNNTPLSNGYILLKLTRDCSINQANGYGQVGGGSVVKLNLNNNGILPSVSIWPNDVLLPSGSQYIMRVYTSQGELVSGPSLITILSTPTPFVIT